MPVSDARTAGAFTALDAAFSELIRSAVVGAVRADSTGRILQANTRFCDMLGLSEEEVLGTSVASLTHPDDVGETLAHIAKVRAGVPGYVLEKRFVHGDGRTVWAVSNVTGMRDEHGRLASLVALVHDISDRKGQERRLGFLAELSHRLGRARDEKEIVRITVESLGKFVGAHRCYFVECFEAENRIAVSHSWSSDGAASLEGSYSLFDFGGMEWWRQYAAGDFSVTDVETDPLTAGPAAAACVSFQVRSYAVQPFKSEGPCTTVIAVTDRNARSWTRDERLLLEDVVARAWPLVERARADRRAAEAREETERQRRLFETVLDGSLDCINVFDRQRRFVYVNRALANVWGRQPPDFIGKSLAETGHSAASVQQHEAEIDRVVETGQPLRSQVSNDGRHYEYIMTPVVGGGGLVEGVAAVTRDMTDSRAKEAALANAARDKDEFIALLAHELRNPLAPLRNGLDVMRLAADDPKVIAGVRPMMERQVAHIMRLVDDLLDASRMGLKKIDLRRSRVLVSNLIADAVESARPKVDAAHHSLRIAVPLEPLYIAADLTRMAQVLGNLLQNSVKYTKPGGRIMIEARAVGHEVEIAVSDNGIGIPPDQLESIFQMYSQVDRSVERDAGGLGIGLGLVKGLVELHGGTVRAMSPGPGQGSTFVVRLPLLPA